MSNQTAPYGKVVLGFKVFYQVAPQSWCLWLLTISTWWNPLYVLWFFEFFDLYKDHTTWRLPRFKGGLNQGRNPDSMGTLRLSRNGSGIVLGWVTFLGLISDAPYHIRSTQSLWWYPGVPDIFNQLCGNLGACPWGDRCWLACPYPFKVITFERRW